ncbi:glutaredoxin-related [Abeliophyllum distichum]|uniref:Glutaredoxin-related n=1 Tax=Abeliophyllum distichum TaxID=126358 RepID=A0ABD1VUV7_9LAMI
MELSREGGDGNTEQPHAIADNVASNHVEEERGEIHLPENEGDTVGNGKTDSKRYGNSDSNVDHEREVNDRSSDIINSADSQKANGTVQELIQQPHSQLPKPEAPPGVNDTCSPPNLSPKMERSVSAPDNFDMPAIGKFIREKSNSFSLAITKRLSSLREGRNNDEDEEAILKPASNVMEFNLVGLKVIKSLKELGKIELKGRISFFSRSNCRDCTAVRSFFRGKNLNFVEINIDVYPTREKELIERTGSGTVPQIFFNEKLIGGLVALNSLRNSGMLEKKMEEMLGIKCPDDAPAPPVYGFDDDEAEESLDEMVAIVRVLRQRLPIQDRLMKMKIVKNCFTGADLVEVLIHHVDCGRKKAIEIGKQLARKHFIHHVFGENEFEDGNHCYRFLEHEPFIPKCHNFRGSVNDSEPKNAATVSQRLTRIMSAILESYASDDRRHLDYVGIRNSEELRRYINLMQDLQRMNLLTLTADEKLAFFLNLHNTMAIHAVIRIGHPGGMIDRRAFFDDFMYVVGGYPYSLSTIRNGILRSNKRAPFSLTKPFSGGDKRLELAFPKVNLLIHFALCNATKSSPVVKFFTAQGVASELRYAAREFFQRDDGMHVDLAKRTVYLSRVIKWYSADFGQEKEIPKWIINYLDATKAVNHGEKPKKFNGLNFKRWQQKILFYLITLNLARFLTEDALKLKQGKRDIQAISAVEAWKHSDFLCRNYVMNSLADSLYNVYSTMKMAKELWESLDRKYKIEEAEVKKFIVGRFLDYKMPKGWF